jgi:hypothetical protein
MTMNCWHFFLYFFMIEQSTRGGITIYKPWIVYATTLSDVPNTKVLMCILQHSLRNQNLPKVYYIYNCSLSCNLSSSHPQIWSYIHPWTSSTKFHYSQQTNLNWLVEGKGWMHYIGYICCIANKSFASYNNIHCWQKRQIINPLKNSFSFSFLAQMEENSLQKKQKELNPHRSSKLRGILKNFKG